MFVRVGILMLCFVSFFQCSTKDKDLEFELRRSFQNYLNALDSRKEEDLRIVFNIPGLKDYKGHVDQLYLKYLDEVEKGHVSFDPQGIVLSRFLRLKHYRYGILDYGKSEDGLTAHMRISVYFAYDANIARSGLEDGTKLFIPGKPLGAVNTLVMGADNPVPRDQLKYLEMEMDLRRTNFEGLWQIMRFEPDEAKAQYEVSVKSRFDP